MGLDMYLRGKKYVSGYEHRDEADKKLFADLTELAGAKTYFDPETPTAEISITVGYWRKANQIHRWFVDNVQDGVDECQPSYVSREKLTELLGICKQIIGSTELVEADIQNGSTLDDQGKEVPVMEKGKTMANPAVAQELLPTQPGFFFGDTEYSQWYWYDIEETVKQLERALAMPDDWDFEYQSSW